MLQPLGCVSTRLTAHPGAMAHVADAGLCPTTSKSDLVTFNVTLGAELAVVFPTLATCDFVFAAVIALIYMLGLVMYQSMIDGRYKYR